MGVGTAARGRKDSARPCYIPALCSPVPSNDILSPGLFQIIKTNYQIWSVAATISTGHLRTADKMWAPTLIVKKGANNPSQQKNRRSTEPRTWKWSEGQNTSGRTLTNRSRACCRLICPLTTEGSEAAELPRCLLRDMDGKMRLSY
jgi:hypothetical protein